MCDVIKQYLMILIIGKLKISKNDKKKKERLLNFNKIWNKFVKFWKLLSTKDDISMIFASR